MKKFLSLALALTMAASMFTVGASAKEFNDGSKIAYNEAVDVVSAAGIVDGYEDGSFNPEATLTRGAAAKIICNLVLGPTTASALNADSAPYSDVPTTNTFAGYIAYCKNEGIISGYADGTFRPANTLTGYAFMKMLLGALGYDSSIEGYTGANWSVNVAKRAIGIELNDGNDDFVGTKPVTRQEACLYAFNTLKATMVEYSDNTTVSVGDITITNKSKATEVERKSGTDYTGYKETDDDEDSCGTQQFVEKYFDKLKGDRVDRMNDFGAPATKWTYDGNTIGTYADDVDKTLTVADADKTVKTLLTGGTYMNYSSSDVKSTAKVYFNGAYAGTYSSVQNRSDLIGKGDIIDVYEDDDNKADTIVIRSYTYAKIDEVTTDLSSTLKNRGASVELSLVDIDDNDVALGDYYDNHNEDARVLNGYEADTYKKGAVLAVALSAGDSDNDSDDVALADEIIDSYVVESITGKPTAAEVVEDYSYDGALTNYYGSDTGVKKGSITVNGTKYKYASQFTGVNVDSDLNFDKEYTVYLTKEGYVLAVDGDATATLSDVYYALGYFTKMDSGKYATYVQALSLEDGTVSEMKVSTKKTSKLADDTFAYYNNSYIAFTALDQLYKMDEDDGKYTGKYYDSSISGSYDVDLAVTLTDEVDGDSTMVKTSAGNSYITDTTKFVSLEGTGADLEVTNATGRMSMEPTYKDNSGATQNVKVTVISHNKDAVFVIYAGENLENATSKADIVYLDDNAKNKTSAGYTGANLWFMDDMTSKEPTLHKDGSRSQGFYRYTLDSNGVYKLKSLKTTDSVTYYSSSADVAYSVESTYDINTTDSVNANGNNVTKAIMGVALEDAKGNSLSSFAQGDAIVSYDANGNAITATAFKQGGNQLYSNLTLTGLSMKNATVIDTRGSSAKDADKYSSAITSTSKLVSALNKGYVIADIYIDDGDVAFIAVTACEDAN